MLIQRIRSIAVLTFVLMAALVVALSDPPGAEAKKVMERGPRRFKFDIDPKTPEKELLPAAPTGLKGPNYLTEDLFDVPEVALGDPIPKSQKNADFEEAAAFALAKINVLNRDAPDGFVKAILAHRADLHGLPFLMGNDCRTETRDAQVFAETVAIVGRQLHEIASRDPEAAAIPNAEYTEKLIWGDFPDVLANRGDAKSKRHQATKSELDRAAGTALTQMLPTRPALWRAGYAKHLGTIADRRATEALAKLTLFAPEQLVREAAIKALKARPVAEYDKLLVAGLRYPLPEVMHRAADALIKLQCKTVLTDLVDELEQPDPRAPRKLNDVMTVREVVRVNHHRNCALCHAPAVQKDVPLGVLTAPVTLPQETMRGYGFGGQSPETFVRVDITYLRQDFSLVQGDARFDYFVRTRKLTPSEATDHAKLVAKIGTRPNHMAAQRALAALVGQTPDDPTAAGWRRLLGRN